MGVEMRISRPKKSAKADVERWAELADRVLIIAREIQFRGYKNPRAVPLTATEGMVMRYLQDHPITAPNQIAAAVGLQRSNLSTLMRGLEREGLIERSYFYAVFISDRLNGQLVSTIAKHVSPITDSIASMFFVDRI